jgi:hypothetical protein
MGRVGLRSLFSANISATVHIRCTRGVGLGVIAAVGLGSGLDIGVGVAVGVELGEGSCVYAEEQNSITGTMTGNNRRTRIK